MPLVTIVSQPGVQPTAKPGVFDTMDEARRDLIRQLLAGAEIEPEPVASTLFHLAESVESWDGPDEFLGPDGMHYAITWFEPGEPIPGLEDLEDSPSRQAMRRIQASLAETKRKGDTVRILHSDTFEILPDDDPNGGIWTVDAKRGDTLTLVRPGRMPLRVKSVGVKLATA